MHLKNAELFNFRCFDRLSVPLHPQLNVFVAENGGGKTTLLDAIATGLSSLLRHLSTANQRLHGPGILDSDFRLESIRGSGMSAIGIVSEATSITLVADPSLEWSSTKFSSRMKSWKSLGLPDLEIGKGQKDLSVYAAGLLESLKQPASSALMPVFAYYGTKRSLIAVPERLRESKVNYSYPTVALLGALDLRSDFRELMKWFDGEEAAELRANRGARELGDGRSLALEMVRQAIRVIFDGKYEDPHFDENRKFVIRRKSDGMPLQVSQLSQGYQSMLALAMDFARRLALANRHHFEVVGGKIQPIRANFNFQSPADAPAIMLVDEIDLHLHPSWQQRVIGDLMRAFPGTQFIVTTHSPQVVSTVRPESIRILRRDENGHWIADDRAANTYGHSNSRSLEAVMGGHAYPEHLQTVSDLREYQRLVGVDMHDSPRALELRATLEKAWGPSDNELQLLDVSIRKNKALRKFRSNKI